MTFVSWGCEPGGLSGYDRAADENQKYGGWQDRGRNPGSYSVSRGGGGDTWSGGPQGGTDGTDGAPDPSGEWHYELQYTDVILSPDGRWLLSMVPRPGPGQGHDTPGLILVAQELPSGERHVFEDQVDLRRINFSPPGNRAYLLQRDGRTIDVLNLETMQMVSASYTLDGAYSTLDVGPMGRFLIASNIPTTDEQESIFSAFGFWGCQSFDGDRCRMALVDLFMNEVHAVELEAPLRDLDWSSVRYEMILTLAAVGSGDGPVATVQFFDPQGRAVVASVDVPNCADELKVQPSGQFALLSPTTCTPWGGNTSAVQTSGRSGSVDCPDPPPPEPEPESWDPISIIDLQARSFVENLPGFGPVVVSADGGRAVGFTRRGDMVSQWNYHGQNADVGLIVVDLETFAWDVIDYGNREPAYYLTPDGEWLYTYEEGQSCVDANCNGALELAECGDLPPSLTRWDLDAGAATPVSGPDLALDQFVVTPDQQTLWALSSGFLVRMELGTASTELKPGGFLGDNLSIRAQGDYLVLGRGNEPRFRLEPLVSDAIGHTLDLAL